MKTRFRGLAARELEWEKIETLLRKAIGRLGIAGRGLDDRLDLLNLEESSDTKIRVQLDVINEVREQELQSLAELINEQLGFASKQTSIDDVMTTLLEPLAVVQGANGAAQETQTWVHEGVDEHQWPDTLNEIVNSISDSLKKLDQKKRELEGFIVNVTEQLGA